MSNVPLMFQPLVKYADFQGRARRSEFWLWVLFRMILGAVMSTIAMSTIFSGINFQSSDPQQIMNGYMHAMPIIGLLNIVNLALFLPSLAVGVRRLHDINRTGWWTVMPIAVVFAGFIIFFVVFGARLFSMSGSGGQMTEAQGGEFALQMVGSMFLCIWLPALVSGIIMLVFYCTDGTPSANRFGADPKGRGVVDKPETVF